MRWALAFLLIVAAAVLVPDGGVRAADDTESARREGDPGCLSCHEQIEVMHPWEPLSCTDCHGGDGTARAKDEAHVQPSRPTPNDERTLPLRYDLPYRRFVNPTDLRIVETTCGQCHADECNNVPKSMHGTTAGHLSDGLYENGVVREKDRRYAIFPVRDEDGDVPRNAYKSLPAIPPPSIAHPDDIGQHFADLPRKSCMVCHLYSRGLGVRGRLGQDGWYRADGCAACHVLYEPDGLSRSRDASIDRLEPGHPRTHELTSKIPTATCTKCHALDANIGMSFRGLAQLPPGVPGGPDVPGTTNKLSKGQFFLNDPAVCPPDVHFERGLHCIDCHTGEDTMGDGNIYGVMDDAVGISCTTCHGTYTSKATFADRRGNKLRHVQWKNGIAILTGKVDGKAHVIKQVVDVLDRGHRDFNAKAARAMDPVKHARLACYACHNAWSVNFFGFHFDRNESFTQLDILSGNRTPGRVTTQEKIFATFRHYYLGVDSHGRISPYMVGFSTTGSYHDKKGVTRLRQALPVTAAGLSGMTMIHHQLHTVRPAARDCDECHGAPGVLGLGSEDFHLFRDLFVVVGDAGLTTCGLDVANPGKSVALANVELPSQPRHVALLNDRLTGRAKVAYVTCRDGSVQVVDLEDPVDPRRVRDVDAGGAQRVHVREGYLFVAAGREGLLIYDITSPRRPRRLASVTTTDARSVFVDGLHAYVADGAGGLRIIDVSEPDRPALRSTVDLNGEDARPLLANDVLVQFHGARPDIRARRRTRARNIAYVADGRAGLYVVDVTRPGQPKVIPAFGRRGLRAFSATSLAFSSNYDLGSAGGDIPSVEREYLYVVGVTAGTSNGRLLKIDVSVPATPVVAGSRRTVDDPRGVRIARVYQPPFLKQFAVVAGRGRGNVEICDVTARVGQIPQAGVVDGTGRVVGIDLESMPLDRLVGFDGKPLKDVSHPKSRLLTKKEITRILRVEER